MPTVIPMIDHLSCHTAVDANIFTRDKACHIRAEIEHHVCNIERITHPARRLLDCIRTMIDGKPVINSAGRYGIDAHLPCKADGKRVCQGRNAAFRRRIALSFRLAHAVTRG